MNNKLSTLCVLLVIGLLSACSVTSPVSQTTAGKSAVQTPELMPGDDLLLVLLRKEFQYWKGAPYRFGGQTKKGIDCSGLVQNIYRSSFNLPLPRTTQKQALAGTPVYKNALQVGDLLFFKSSRKVLHVGIYMGKKEFLHASSSKGVMLSSLADVYWRSRYWQARRIID